MISKIKESYAGAWDILGRYWRAYGGWQALIFSPYFHIAILLTLIMYRFWNYKEWWDVAISILPNMLGFSLAGYAIWLGFGDDDFRRLISGQDDTGKESPYVEVSAAFAHFIIIQIFAIVAAVIAKSNYYQVNPNGCLATILHKVSLNEYAILDYVTPLFHGLGFLLFIYAIMTALAATLAVFRVATLYDKIRGNNKSQ